MNLTIDPEFLALIPPLAPDKIQGLELELIADGGPRDPIIVWQHSGQNIIVDGHNRFALCQKHGLQYRVSIKHFENRDEAKAWMFSNQLNRRNLTDEQVCMLAAMAGMDPPGVLAASPHAALARDLVGTKYPSKVLTGFFTLRQAHNRWKKATLPPEPKLAIVPKKPEPEGLWVAGAASGFGAREAARAIAMEHGDVEQGAAVHGESPSLMDAFVAAARKHPAGWVTIGDSPRQPLESITFGAGVSDIVSCGRGHTIIVSDLHAPFHDVRGWAVCLAAIEALKPERVVVIGDAADCYAVSNFDKSPQRLTRLVDELEGFGQEMRRLRKAAGEACSVVYCQGNHEHRIDKLLTKIAALHGITSAKDLVEKYLPSCEWVSYRSVKRVGKVVYTHDMDFAGVYAAQHTLVATGTNVVFGHTHRGGLAIDGDYLGDRRFSLNVGWLGDPKQADYMHDIKKMRLWTLGFGHVYECPDTGMLWPSFVPILRDRCFIAGQMVRI
jgi:hypothetical protein